MGMVFQNPDDQLFVRRLWMTSRSVPPIWDGVEEVIAASQRHYPVGLEGYGSRTSYHLSFGEERAAIATIFP